MKRISLIFWIVLFCFLLSLVGCSTLSVSVTTKYQGIPLTIKVAG
jgi:hypothetical protein